MKLYYFDGKVKEFKVSNFGDDLNPWLWDRLLPNVFDEDDKTLFVGIGTLLNDRLPKQSQKLVFGSGIGYGDVPTVDHRWKIYFVRGQLSAKALELDAKLGLADPAILVCDFWQSCGEKNFRRSYMPHYHEQVFNGAAWKEICEGQGIHYIDPTDPIEQVLSEIDRSEILLTEAMHGAIVADALRVPWVAVKTKQDILSFKWKDWLSTLEIPYIPYTIKRFASRPSKQGLLKYCDYQLIQAQMAYIMRTAKPSLSSLSKHQELEEKVASKLEAFKLDLANGLFD